MSRDGGMIPGKTAWMGWVNFLTISQKPFPCGAPPTNKTFPLRKRDLEAAQYPTTEMSPLSGATPATPRRHGSLRAAGPGDCARAERVLTMMAASTDPLQGPGLYKRVTTVTGPPCPCQPSVVHLAQWHYTVSPSHIPALLGYPQDC